jgi:hypothetical protein
MSKFQAISLNFGVITLGSAVGSAVSSNWTWTAFALFVGLSSLIASGFAAAAGDN